MERDLRILTLFKQHYLDEYNQPLESDYSCWGYYDGISIKEVKPKDSKLFEKRTKAPVSELWYNSMEQTEKLGGIHSRQNIGIFRCMDTDVESRGERFWESNEKMPFFAVGFLQLRDKRNYQTVAQNIEKEFWLKDFSSKDFLKYGVITYCTFDNADLVVLINGNSIKKLEQIIRNIAKMEDVRYCHSVMGVSEAYLANACELDKKDEWEAKDCCGEDRIKRVTMKIVTSGDFALREKIKEFYQSDNKLKQLIQFVQYYDVTGHENIVMDLGEIRVKDFLRLLFPEGFATHQNLLYGRGIYNIETSICMEKEDFSTILRKPIEKEKLVSISWCSKKVKKYQQMSGKALNGGDESLYSYYLALIQTLNTLAQYEMFSLSKDIFYLLFPAMEMFDKQMDVALKNKVEETEALRDSICEFLDSVNSIIYHTVHTDQVFLMIPGYSGTTFAIPIKLCLLYSWFIKEIIELLNDSEKPFKYECLLVPVIESKPHTDSISMGLPHGDRLICVKLSQRSLYMPRNLMIILAHEVAHYVGDEIRNREKRLEYIIKTLSGVIAEGIIPRALSEEGFIADAFVRINKIKICSLLIDALIRNMREKHAQDGYHGDDIKGDLIGVTEKLLLDNKNEITETICKIPNEVAGMLEEKGSKFVENAKVIQKYQHQFEDNCRDIVISGIISDIVGSLMKMYREVFSDMVAVSLLDFGDDIYEEASRISEGKIYGEGVLGVEGDIRKSMINYVREGIKPRGSHNEKMLGEKDTNKNSSRLIKDLYSFENVLDLLKKYAVVCYNDTKRLLEKQGDKLKEIRRIFELFNDSKKHSCETIYSEINEKVVSYNENIEKHYKELIKE